MSKYFNSFLLLGVKNQLVRKIFNDTVSFAKVTSHQTKWEMFMHG
jgi:hypothetical protein